MALPVVGRDASEDKEQDKYRFSREYHGTLFCSFEGRSKEEGQEMSG
jgi:hypothetical protein